jgi:hypothetical protein
VQLPPGFSQYPNRLQQIIYTLLMNHPPDEHHLVWLPGDFLPGRNVVRSWGHNGDRSIRD